MIDHFTLAPLDEEGVLQAYPLVREVHGNLTVDAWCKYAGMLLSPAPDGDERGIIGICAGQRYLRGLFTYRISPDVQHGRSLTVEYFLVESVISPRTVALALLAGVESLARKMDCDAIHTDLNAAPEWLTDVLRERGYGRDARHLCKTLSTQS